jgi:alpha-D-ribose 1-methylphosphonate 5-triphosphate diphosphatase
MTMRITGGRVLRDGRFDLGDVRVNGSHIAGMNADGFGPSEQDMTMIDATGLMVLPGIVDIHGDAFERQISPRPGVEFPVDLALLETDRQLVANGITTASHAVTCSWEPGLRSLAKAGAVLDAIERCRPRLCAETLFHLRHEIFNLDAEAVLTEWIASGRISALAFNDHMEGIVRTRGQKASKLARMVERSGMTPEAFMARADQLWAREAEVPGSIARMAEAARKADLPMLSHDDRGIEDRQAYRALGVAISEFPMAEDVAREARSQGEHVVFGAPNVLRGGSHTGCPSARDMVAGGLCTILASDYFYPALAGAVDLLDKLAILDFASAWALVSRNPAEALGLSDRGEIAAGRRADIVLARRDANGISIVATIVAGRIALFTEPERHTGRRARAA